VVELRRAGADDLGFLSQLACDPSVEPYLAPGAGEPERLSAILERAEDEGPPSGLFLIHSPAGEPLGGLALVVYSRRSRLCDLTSLMVIPRERGRGVASEAVRLACRHALVEHGFHRVQAEIYGDNLASQRLFERVGFVREGARRRAYWRREKWLDGVIFGILAEEVGQ
jgi:RimJ/RimL family protein N-acetyltransferase